MTGYKEIAVTYAKNAEAAIWEAPILPADIRKGDNIRRETEDVDGKPVAYEYWANVDGEEVWATSNTYFLLSRPVPPVVLPDVPGVYFDCVNDTWLLNTAGRWDCIGCPTDSENPTRYAPFTRLRPEAEVAAEVLADVRSLFGPGALMLWLVNAIATKWAAK